LRSKIDVTSPLKSRIALALLVLAVAAAAAWSAFLLVMLFRAAAAFLGF
jgi:hypothetical protein